MNLNLLESIVPFGEFLTKLMHIGIHMEIQHTLLPNERVGVCVSTCHVSWCGSARGKAFEASHSLSSSSPCLSFLWRPRSHDYLRRPRSTSNICNEYGYNWHTPSAHSWHGSARRHRVAVAGLIKGGSSGSELKGFLSCSCFLFACLCDGTCFGRF